MKRRDVLARISLAVAIQLMALAAFGGDEPQEGATGGDGGSASVGPRHAIPNQVDPPSTSLTSQKGTPESDSTASSGSGATAGFEQGLVRMADAAAGFTEDPRRPGFPLGWFTSSAAPVLLGQSGAYHLRLPESEDTERAGTLVSLSSGAELEIIMDYESEGGASVRVTRFDTSCTPLAEPLDIELPVGKMDDFMIRINALQADSNLLVAIQNEPGRPLSVSSFRATEVLP